MEYSYLPIDDKISTIGISVVNLEIEVRTSISTKSIRMKKGAVFYGKT